MPLSSLHVEDRGAGDPLLAIGGFAVSSAVFDTVADGYAEHFRYVTYDHPGTGRSTRRALPITTAALAASAVRVLDELGIDSAHVIGHSLGGAIATELALRFPHRVRGLILVGTSTSGPLSVPPSPRTLARALRHGMRTAFFSEEFLAHEPDRTRLLMRGVAAHRAPPWSLVGQFLAAGLHDRALDLHRIAAPTLVIHGERDVLVPVANAHRLAAGIPDAELQIVPGAGHAVELERPGETLAIVREWLARRSPVAGPVPGPMRVRGERLGRELAVPLGALRVARSALVLLTSGTGACGAPPAARSRTPTTPARGRRASSQGG